MNGLMKRATTSLLVLLALSIGTRLIYSLLEPLLPFLTWTLVLIGIYAMIFGFTRRL